MEAEIKELERRAFKSWEYDFTPRLMSSNGLIRVGCATFTMAKQRHRNPKSIRGIIDRYFHQLAKRQDRHFVWLFGEAPEDAKEQIHQQGDIFLLGKEGEVKDLKTYGWLLEASFKFGRCEIEPKRSKGNWTGYCVQKHDGNDDFLKIYCPKTGQCGKHTKSKGDRRFCVYQRQAMSIT